ncbi:hypothetical protein LTS15_010981 [Exophiala xenobiotica]|nr:hypothetical protein LTS15_010981 [Exophiala xenobiotica]
MYDEGFSVLQPKKMGCATPNMTIGFGSENSTFSRSRCPMRLKTSNGDDNDIDDWIWFNAGERVRENLP